MYTYLQKGMHREALAICQQMLEPGERHPQNLWGFGYASAVLSRRDQAKQALTELHEWAHHSCIRPLALACISIGSGEKESALAWLEQAYTERDPSLSLLNIDPVYDSLRAEPRIVTLVKRIGIGP